MTNAPVVEEPDNRAAKVARSPDGLFYTFSIYCVEGSKVFDLMAGVPMRQIHARGYQAEFTLPAQIVAEMFAGVAEAAMTTPDAEAASDRILAPATA